MDDQRKMIALIAAMRELTDGHHKLQRQLQKSTVIKISTEPAYFNAEGVSHHPHLDIQCGAVRCIIPVPNDMYFGPPLNTVEERFSHACELGEYLMLVEKDFPSISLIGTSSGFMRIKCQSYPEAINVFNRIVNTIEQWRTEQAEQAEHLVVE